MFQVYLSRLDTVATQNYEFVQKLKSKHRMLKIVFLNILIQPAIHTLLSKN